MESQPAVRPAPAVRSRPPPGLRAIRRRVVLGFAGLTWVPLLITLDTCAGLAAGWRPTGRLQLLVALATPLAVLAVGVGLASSRLRALLVRRWPQAVLLGLSLAAVVVVGEATTAALKPPFHRRAPHLRRVFHPDPKLTPGVEGDAVFSTDALGVRGPELPKGDAYRILCIGGSTTECLYLDDSEAWPALLMQRLQQASDERVWVGNTGISGYGSKRHLKFVRESPLMRRLDCLLVLVGINDLQHALAAGVHPSAPAWTRSGLLLLARSVWHGPNQDRFLQDLRGEFYARSRARRQRAPRRETLPDLTTFLAEYRATLQDLVRGCREAGVRPVLLTQPVLWRADLPPALESRLWFGWTAEGDYLSSAALREGMHAYNQVLRQVAAQEHVECVDLAAALDGRPQVFMDDCHFTEEGARDVARLCATSLLARPPLRARSP